MYTCVYISKLGSWRSWFLSTSAFARGASRSSAQRIMRARSSLVALGQIISRKSSAAEDSPPFGGVGDVFQRWKTNWEKKNEGISGWFSLHLFGNGRGRYRGMMLCYCTNDTNDSEDMQVYRMCWCVRVCVCVPCLCGDKPEKKKVSSANQIRWHMIGNIPHLMQMIPEQSVYYTLNT